MCMEFQDEILLRVGGDGGECETPKKIQFSEKW